jgi:predicted AlkP superfamily phosphohydrolase/phosphomutase
MPRSDLRSAVRLSAIATRGPTLRLIRFTATVLFAIGCNPAPELDLPPVSTGRVLIFGVDGATWRVMDPLLREGKLPNFAELADSGCRGSLASLWPSYSPAIWTSIATGVPPPRHGIKGFAYKVDGRRHLYTSDMVEVLRIWDIASGAGRRVGVTNYWFTYPALPVNGYVISDHAIPARSARMIKVRTAGRMPAPERERLVAPPELWEPVRAPLDRHEPRVVLSTEEWTHHPVISDLAREDEQAVEMAHLAAAGDPPDREIIYVRAVDGTSHRYWIYYEPDHPLYDGSRPNARDVERYGELIPLAYRHSDALLGEIREGLEPEDVMLVVSDHGHGAVRPNRKATGGHGGDPSTLDGIYLIAGGPVSPANCPAELSLYDIAPTVLHLLGVEVPADMIGEVASDLFDVSWMDAHPVRLSGSPMDAPPISGAPPEMPELEEEHRLGILRALGYIE